MAEPGQAPPQDIIALYLQGRDVPCPACGYNRRDDTAPPCPECGHHLRLQPVARNPLEDRSLAYTLHAVSIAIAASAAITCGTIIYLLRDYPPNFHRKWATFAFLAVIGATISGLVTAFRATNRGQTTHLRKFIGITGFSAVLFAIGMIVSLWDQLF